MGEEVAAWTRTKESEEGETRRYNDPSLGHGATPSSGHDLRGCEESNGPEQRSRGSNRIVVSAIGDGGEGIASGAGEQNQPEADTRAELVTRRTSGGPCQLRPDQLVCEECRRRRICPMTNLESP